MPDPHRQLHATVARRARRPIPAAWTNAEPDLARYPCLGDLHHTIRCDDPQPRADQAVRALIRLTRVDSEASVVLLDALGPAVNRTLGPTTTAEFRREILAELAVVILEVDHPERLDHLARRLAKRAHRRTIRRGKAEARHSNRLAVIDDADTVPNPYQLEDRVLDRIQLREIGRQLRRAVDHGQLSPQTMSAFLDGKLLPALTGTHLPVDRRTTYTATHIIRRHLEHTC
jgi:hypothetical protein